MYNKICIRMYTGVGIPRNRDIYVQIALIFVSARVWRRRAGRFRVSPLPRSRGACASLAPLQRVACDNGGADVRTQNETVWSPHGKKYAPEEVLRAVSLVVDGRMNLREAERATGVSRETVRRWQERLEPGEGACTLAMDAGDGKEAPMDRRARLGDLPDDPGSSSASSSTCSSRSTSPGRRWTILKKGPGADPGPSPTGRRRPWSTP